MKQKQSFIEIKKNDYNNWQVEQKCKNNVSVDEKNSNENIIIIKTFIA